MTIVSLFYISIVLTGYLHKIMIRKKSSKNLDTLPTQEEEEGEEECESVTKVQDKVYNT